MIHPFQRANVVAVEDYLPFQFVPVLLDVVVLYHNHHHIHLAQELVEVQDLILHNLLVGEEGVETLQRTGQVTFLNIQHLKRGAFANVIYIFLVGDAVETHAAVIGDAVLLHDLIDALQDEGRLTVVGLHTLVNNLCQLGIIPYQEPGIYADSMATHTGARLKDVHTRMHVADAYDLIHVHIVVPADAAQFVGKGDVDGTESVLHHLGHLGGADVGDHDLPLAERSVILLHALTHFPAVGTDRTIVVEQFIDHIARDDAFRSMDQMDVLPYLETARFYDGTDILVDRAGADRGLDDHGCTPGADFHHVLYSRDDITGVHFFTELIIGGGHRDYVRIRTLVFCREQDTFDEGCLEEFIQTVFLESRLAGIEGGYEFLVVVRADDFNTVGSHHQGRRETNVA